jgi:hypothetical protein
MTQEEGPQQGFKGVADGDPTGGERRGASPHINQQGTQRDAGPEAHAIQCQGGQGDAGRWPHHRGDAAYGIERQAKRGRADIDAPQ